MSELELDLSNSIEFYSLRTNIEQILAEKEVKLSLQVKIKKKFSIKDISTGQNILNVDKIFLISPIECNLTLIAGMKSLCIKLNSEQEYLQIIDKNGNKI